MRLKDLFTVPTGHKVTDMHLRRVLISSIFSILLCMSCLVGSTWAWFTVSIENTDNVIQIGEPEIIAKLDGSQIFSGTDLPQGTYRLSMEHANVKDDLDIKSTLYVTLSFRSDTGTNSLFTILDKGNDYMTEISISSNKPTCELCWDVSWFAPANAIELTDSSITLTADPPAEPPTDNETDDAESPADDANEPSTEPTTEPVTEPSTEPVTEPSTDPTTEPSTEPATESATEPITEPPAESSTEAATEPSTDPSMEDPTESPDAEIT